MTSIISPQEVLDLIVDESFPQAYWPRYPLPSPEDEFKKYNFPDLMRLALVSSGFRNQVVFNCRKDLERGEASKMVMLLTKHFEAEREIWVELSRKLACGCDQCTIPASLSPSIRI